MKLIKRFSYQEFLSDNKCVCAPTILDGLIVYRDGRPCNPICDPINEYKVLKIGKIDQNLNEIGRAHV